MANYYILEDGKPLYETLVFGGLLDGEMERYTTVEDARAGHERMVERIKEAVAQGGGR